MWLYLLGVFFQYVNHRCPFLKTPITPPKCGHHTTPSHSKMPSVAALLLVAALGATAFTPPRLFAPPRTRARALAYAKKAVFKDDNKDSVATPVPPLKGSRQGRVEMIIDPSSGVVAGARPLPLTKR